MLWVTTIVALAGTVLSGAVALKVVTKQGRDQRALAADQRRFDLVRIPYDILAALAYREGEVAPLTFAHNRDEINRPTEDEWQQACAAIASCGSELVRDSADDLLKR